MDDIENILKIMVYDTTGDHTPFPEIERDFQKLRKYVENPINLDDQEKTHFAMMLKIISETYINKLDICYAIKYLPEPIQLGKYGAINMKTLLNFVNIANNSSVKHGYKINTICQNFENNYIIVIPDKCKPMWISIIMSILHDAMLDGSPIESNNDDTVVVILNKNEDYLEISNAVFIDDSSFDHQLTCLHEEAIKWFFSKFNYPDVEIKHENIDNVPKRLVRIPLKTNKK
jgi:hypothetical protein